MPTPPLPPRASALVLLLLPLVGCPSAPIPSEGQRAVISLDGAFDRSPWMSPPLPEAELSITATVTLPAARRAAAADLVLDGLWFHAKVSVDGEELPVVHGGAPTLRVPLGDALADGEATITVRARPPVESFNPRVTGGGLSTFRQTVPLDRPWLARPPRLELHPVEQVRTSALVAEKDGDVTPMAWTENAPAGAIVRFSARLDGELVQALGEAPVGADGKAVGAPVDWDGPRWTPSAPHLVHFEATLIDATGKVLDHRADRTGVRRVSIKPLTLAIEDEELRVHAVRANFFPTPRSLLDEAGGVLEWGVNAVEFHGEFAPEDWYVQADELGLPVIRLARCAGLASQHSGTAKGFEDVLIDQDRRTVEGLHHHPSAVLWVAEPGPVIGKDGPSNLDTARLADDPHRRPRVPGDVHGVPIDPNQAKPCGDYPCRGGFAREVLAANPQTWARAAVVWGQQLQAGMWGGVLPTAEAVHGSKEPWRQVFAPLLASAGVQPWPQVLRRAPSAVLVSGLPAGTLAFLEVPGLPAVGALVHETGTVELSAWHEGPATLRVGDQTQALTLKAGAYDGSTRRTAPASLSWAPVPPAP
jgi:hypothetical protein